MSREAMKQALEALELAHPRFGIATERHKQAIAALRAALDKPLYRRGTIVRCLESEELATVYTTSIDGDAWVKWPDGSIGAYTAEQMGKAFAIELKWQEPEPVAWIDADDNLFYTEEDAYKTGIHPIQPLMRYSKPTDGRRCEPGSFKWNTPADEPVFDCPRCGHCCPQPAAWVGLTDEEILAEIPVTTSRPATSFARAIEAKLKEKNT